MIDGQMDGWGYRQIYTHVHITGMGWIDGWTSEQSVFRLLLGSGH